MLATGRKKLIDAIRDAAVPLHGGPADHDPLLELIGDARVVCLGEATHGTHEFYRERARITRRLIEERGFDAIAIEGDWPDAYRVNRYVHGLGEDGSAEEALRGFRRFPTWMWRNADVVDLVGWLRARNDRHAAHARKASFLGLDLYSLFASIAAVVEYLDRIDPAAAKRARARYACFDSFGEDTHAYGFVAGKGLAGSCEQEVVDQLVEIRRSAARLLERDGLVAEDELFAAEQNARLARNAEEYYRAMFRGRVSSWNLRDRHMAETLDALLAHLGRHGRRSKVVVWEHNSHLGDARATEMGDQGELNVGQLARERYGADAVLVGFTTYAGSVTAASDWDAPAERKRVRPALADSYEALLHEVGIDRFLLRIRGAERTRGVLGLREPRLERAIGVVYRPESERASHYFEARLPDQFDAVVHVDETRAVEPIERTAGWEAGESPETYPSGL